MRPNIQRLTHKATFERSQFSILETVIFGQNAGDLRPINRCLLPTNRSARRCVARSDHLNEQWVCSANDRATDKYLVFALEKVLKLVRRCFGPPPKCLPEI